MEIKEITLSEQYDIHVILARHGRRISCEAKYGLSDRNYLDEFSNDSHSMAESVVGEIIDYYSYGFYDKGHMMAAAELSYDKADLIDTLEDAIEEFINN